MQLKYFYNMKHSYFKFKKLQNIVPLNTTTVNHK